MYLIVGLGNPEKKYEKTFHNMGYIAVGDAAEALGAKFKKKECEASVAEAFVSGEKVILARPLTYMNNSGRAVKQLMSKYKISEENLIVIYDDYDLPKGKVRIRASGSAGTHNGMRSIIGDVKGKRCLMIDDMIDTAGTLCQGAQAIKDAGATAVYAGCTHAILSGPALDRLEKSAINKFVMLDTIALPES